MTVQGTGAHNLSMTFSVKPSLYDGGFPQTLTVPGEEDSFVQTSGQEAAPPKGPSHTSTPPEAQSGTQLSFTKRVLAGFLLGLSLIGIAGTAGSQAAPHREPQNNVTRIVDADTEKPDKKTDLNTLYQAIDSYGQDAVDLQKELTSRPAISSTFEGKGEAAKGEFLKEYMKKLGYSSMEEYNAPDPSVPAGYHPNMVFRFKGKSSEKTIWVMSHLDTVPVGTASEWNTNPLEAQVIGDRIYGLGVEDNQQGVVSSIMAMKAFHDTGTKPEYDVALLFVSDEETGSAYGIQHVLKQNPEIFKKNDMVIVPDFGNEQSSLIEVSEKAIVWLRFATHGKSTHGSMPHRGINANRAASALSVKLDELYKEFNLNDPLFDPPYSTFEPTKREANGLNINTVPGEDVFYMDTRILPQYKVDDVLKKIDELCGEIEKKYGVTIDVKIENRDEAAPGTSPDAPVVTALTEAVKDVYGVQAKPGGVGGGTVAFFIRNAGIPAAAWYTSGGTEHMANENVKIGTLLNDAKVYANVFTQGPKAAQ